MDRALSDDLREGIDARAPTLPATKPGTIRPTQRREITAWVRARLSVSTWKLFVPGYHPTSGLTYDALLDILKDQGRDFRAETTAMRRSVLAELQLRFEELGRIPTVKEFNESLGLAVLRWMVLRFEGKVRDVKLQRLTLAYAHAKKAAGYGNRPIGVATGSLALRVAEFGEVRVRKT
jgi:hypothetical protein